MSIGTQIRNSIDVRLADPDVEPVVDWCQANSERNAFDRDVLSYPSTKILAAHDNGTTIAYLPVQGVAMLESLGPNPEVNPIQVTAALVQMVKGAGLMAYANGMRELYFLASDETTALGAEHMGFVKLNFTVYRKRLE